MKKPRLNPEWVKVDKRQKMAHKIAVAAGYPKGFIYDFDQTPLRFGKNARPPEWPDVPNGMTDPKPKPKKRKKKK